MAALKSDSTVTLVACVMSRHHACIGSPGERYGAIAGADQYKHVTGRPTVALVTDEAWNVGDDGTMLTGDAAVELVRRHIARGDLETWFESPSGRSLAVVSNGARALVMLLAEPGDEGEHAVDPAAAGEMGGYILSNGQHDSYANADTVELSVACAIVQHIVDRGGPPAGTRWQPDR
jgi:hypothetical protein